LFRDNAESLSGQLSVSRFPNSAGRYCGRDYNTAQQFPSQFLIENNGGTAQNSIPKTAGVQIETIHIARLDDVAKDISIKGKVVIKIDVQGFEDKVIAGGTETFKRASLILIETSFVELYEGQPLFGDIHDQLRALGFSYYGSAAEHRNQKTGELLYQDSIFVRN